MPEDGANNIEEWIESVLVEAMANSLKLTEKVSAAKVAVQYLAVKARIGVPFGSDLDEE